MGFLANAFKGAGKLSIVFLTLYAIVYGLQWLDETLRNNWDWYKRNMPNVWWISDIRCEMENNHQSFTEAMPDLTQLVWVPIILFSALTTLKLFRFSL